MRNRTLHNKDFIPFVLVLIPLGFLGVPASAQSVSGQSNVRIQDNDTTRIELAHFDQFMDSHREIAEQLRKDPSLVNNREFVEKHPALQTYLQEHPGIREEIKENPNAFMRQENRFDRQEDRRQGERDSDTTRAQLAHFDQFMDSHREIAEQLRKDPSLVNNREFVEKHPALQTYLQEHPGIREEIKENPNAFMRQENRFDRQEDRRQGERDSDTTRAQLAHFDQFMDGHREIAEQLRKDPSLVNNREFVEKHPALQTYLQEHPGVREEIKENPNAFMRQENRFDRQEDRRQEARFEHQEFRREDERRDETSNGHVASFREFLGGHPDIARQVSKNPSVVKNDNYVKHNPELHGYLNAHPGVRGELMADPQKFVKSTQQFSNSTGTAGTTKTPAPAVDLKPKQ